MRSVIIVLLLMISISHVSCEDELEVFSIEQCVGKYVCDIDGSTTMVLTGGRKDIPDVPLTSYPKRGTVITVTKTGDTELTLTLTDRIMVAQVDESGKLTIPSATICMENKSVSMTLTAEYPTAYITHNMLYLKQVASGTALCDDKGDKYTLPVSNTQLFEGKK